MKNIFFLALLITLFNSCSKDESLEIITDELTEIIVIDNNENLPEKVFNYDLVLTDQIEVDLIAKEKYTKINGNVIIKNNLENTNPITNLDSLFTIKTISKSLIITSTSITKLKGLKNLESVSENIEIINNPFLGIIDGLGLFTEVKKIVINNIGLRLIKIPHLKKVEKIEIDQYSRYNTNLLEVKINNLQEVDDIFISVNNFELEFNSLENITGSLILRGDFLDMNGFKKLIKSGELTITGNNLITNLEGLESVKMINNITLERNINMKNINGLDDLNNNSLTQFRFIDLVKLEDISSLKNQKNIKNIVLNNTGLSNIEDLANSNGVMENIFIEGNENLTNLNGLNNVIEVNNISIENSYEISDLQGLLNLEKIKNLTIKNNSNLLNLSGLDQIKVIESAYIEDNSSLNNINTLKDVVFNKEIFIKRNGISEIVFRNTTSLDRLEIEINYNLKKIELDNLKTIGNLIIHHNQALTEINNIENLESINSFLRLTYNTQLSDLCSFVPVLSNPINFSYHIEYNSCFLRLTVDQILSNCNQC
jgi:hypothetical protein